MPRQYFPRFGAHVKAHETVLNNEYWYGNESPDLGQRFSAKKTAERQASVLDILLRATDRAARHNDRKLAKEYHQLYEKLENCHRRHRCGSLACPRCARAFQRALVAAERHLIDNLESRNSRKQLVFVTIIPRAMTYEPGELHKINIGNANRWLKDILDDLGIKRIIFGRPDLGWESRRGGKYFQLHWHLATWTRHPTRLKAQLKIGFKRGRKYERPVDVEVTYDQGFLPYMNKVIKLPDLLRRARRQLPELLLTLDGFDPFDFLVLRKLRFSADKWGIALNRIRKGARK